MRGEKMGPYAARDVLKYRMPVFCMRRDAGLTQPELAQLAGVSERTVRNAETWGDTGSRPFRAVLSVLGSKTTRPLFDDDEIVTLAHQLADGGPLCVKTGKPRAIDCSACTPGFACPRKACA